MVKQNLDHTTQDIALSLLMPLEFHEHRLSNGLTIVAETNADAHTAGVGFFVRAGTRDEALDVMGVSHFLEHMMFKGTARRSADDVNREFDEIGANYNAYTSHELTVYYAHILPEYLPRAVDLLGDMLRPSLRDDDFDMEKNVILEEIGMYEDRPAWRLQDMLLERYFAGHPLGYRVLGTVDSIKALTSMQMRDYFNQRYCPESITVSAAGRVDFDALVKDIETIAGKWQPTGATRVYDQPMVEAREVSLRDEKLSRHYMMLMCPGPAADDPRRYAARVMADILGDADGSRLYWALVDPGIADEADFSSYPQDRIGAYFSFCSCDPERADEVERILIDTIRRFPDELKADEIERAKNKIATQATLAGESPGGRMRAIGGQWAYLGEYLPLSEELERIMAVTEEDLRKLFADMPLDSRTLVRLGPGVEG